MEGVTVPSPRTDLLVRVNNLRPLPADVNVERFNTSKSEKPPCYMCSLGLEVKHTDVLILSQFVRSDGCMLPRRITGLCRRQQKKIGKMVTMAQKAGLFSYNYLNVLVVYNKNALDINCKISTFCFFEYLHILFCSLRLSSTKFFIS